MKKSFIVALSLLLSLTFLVMPMVVSASTASEKVFDPYSTMWYSVEFVRTSAANASDDAYVYTWTPEADGQLTLSPDKEYKDTLVSVVNKSDSDDSGVVFKYYPKGGFNSTAGVTYNVKAGNDYEISVMTCTETSGTVAFFAYYTQSTVSGLEGAGTYANPYLVDDSVNSLPSIKEGETVYYLYACDKTKKYDVKVNGSNANDSFDLYVENNKATAVSENGSASVATVTPFAASGYIMFSITNKNTGIGGGYSLQVTVADVGTKGTYEDPATLVLDKLSTANISSVCYYYTYTATEDGTLSIKIENESNWVCSISGGVSESAYCSASDEPVVNPIEYPVTTGEEISMWVATEEFGAGSVSFTASLIKEEETTVTESAVVTTVSTEPEKTDATEVVTTQEVQTTVTEPEVVVTVPTDPVEETSVVTDPVEETTAATEPVTTVVTEPVVETTIATQPTEVVIPTTVPEKTETDEEGAFVELYDDYCLSTSPVQLGDNTITISKVFGITLFEFTPSEFAVYTITASDANAIVGAYAGTVNYIPATAVGTSNSTSLEFSSGADIIIAVSNTSTCNLNIAKTGDVEIKEESKWNVYDNLAEVNKFETSIDVTGLVDVMIYDNEANKAVLGNDGYFHLDSEQGEILYVNLNSNIMSLVKIIENGKLCAVFYDEEGNVTEKIDYTDAVLEYIDNAAQIVNGEETVYLYPLTADLIEMYQVVGLANDWYGRTGWVGGIADDAWMFACFYQEGVYSGDNTPGLPSNPSTIPTGREFVLPYIAVVIMISAAGIVLFARKRITD